MLFEVEYVADGVRVASVRKTGTRNAARRIAEDGLLRHSAHHARIIDLRTGRAEIWPRRLQDGVTRKGVRSDAEERDIRPLPAKETSRLVPETSAERMTNGKARG